jgi:nucleolar protein 58
MLVLYETAAGYALFKVKDDGKVLNDVDQLYKEFQDGERAQKL